MVREIYKGEAFLAQKSESAAVDDLGVAQDLLDALITHKDGCVVMAANMIGINKRIIAFDNDGKYMVMFNPVIVKQSGPYEAEEGCLSLTGIRKTKRFRTIKVQWQNYILRRPYKKLLAGIKCILNTMLQMLCCKQLLLINMLGRLENDTATLRESI